MRLPSPSYSPLARLALYARAIGPRLGTQLDAPELSPNSALPPLEQKAPAAVAVWPEDYLMTPEDKQVFLFCGA